jgi:hypothetical protein
MSHLVATVLTNDVPNFLMPRYFLVVGRTIDIQLLTCKASCSTRNEMEQEAFLALAFLEFQEKYLQTTSIRDRLNLQNALPFYPPNLRVGYHNLDISGIGSRIE